MAKQLHQLSARATQTITTPGRHSDGGSLYLVVGPSGSKRWAFLYKRHSKQREMGLGAFPLVSLSEARKLASEARRVLARGLDPIDARQGVRGAAPTFGECADKLIASKSPGWRNEKHRSQWITTLETYAARLRGKPVDAITTDDVLGVLRPLWSRAPETASRLRGRIEAVLDAATAAGHREGLNPARLKGHLDHLLSERPRLAKANHAAMPYGEVPAFVEALRARSSVAALALEFAILTAARAGEATGAVWDEIDLEAGVWTIPGERMKAGREHVVPLSNRALAILAEVSPLGPGKHVFPGVKSRRPLSVATLGKVVRQMVPDGRATVHGFRSSFRDWCGEETDFPREVAEAALAHQVGSAVERAYRRGTALAKRRELMAKWEAFCSGADGKVIVLADRRRAWQG